APGRGGCGPPPGRRAGRPEVLRSEKARSRRHYRNSASSRAFARIRFSQKRGSGLLQAKIFAHVTIVFFLAALGAEVKSQLIDDLNTIAAQPVGPAIGAHGLEDTLADRVAHGWFWQFAGVAAGHAAGTVTVEAIAAGRCFLRRRP